ncbi:hypothetical protein [Agathobacter rectalis]|uniref:hypothetical protein n=1 Tax=Agathobacter rectalis TaxID=39491 RepID=UPI0027D2C48E|nr:hypothetical protein [Agathobacter rectalis]MCB7108833.1 hypothetical protein [Agathobacter rectalis]MCG4812125.1 hypothetical protein [Agathobacter rectalis]
MKTYKNVITYVEKSMISDSLGYVGLMMILLGEFFIDATGIVLDIIALLLVCISWLIKLKIDKNMIKFVSEDFFKYTSIINAIFLFLAIIGLFKTNKYMIFGTVMGVIGIIINGILEIRYLKKTKPEIPETNTTGEDDNEN